MRYGVVDIGANTVRLQVYSFKNKVLTSLFTKKTVAGLVTYIENGRFTEKGFKKLIMVLQGLFNTIDIFSLRKVFVFATASLRSVENLAEVKKVVKKETGIDLIILSQEEEARLGYLGIELSFTDDAKTKQGYTVDIGGGSIEIVQFKNREANVYLNLGFGCLSLYKDFVELVLPTKQEIKRIEAFAKKKIKIGAKASTNTIFGIGGTMRAVGNILSEFLPNNINTRFSYNDVLILYKNLISKNKDLFQVVLQVTPERVHTIIPGTIVVKNILEKFSAKEVIVCNTGLREGVLLSKLK
ncbi:MAG: hypothetical protein P1P64_10145 [Treponemataceae bacterium]